MIQLTEKVLAVKVPKDAIPPIIRVSDMIIFSTGSVQLPPGKWEIIGKASELTESVLEPVIKGQNFADDEVLFPKYNDKGEELASDFCGTRLESFHSLLRSKGIFLVNPYGEKPERMVGDTMMAYKNKLKQWQEAENKKSDPIILKIVK